MAAHHPPFPDQNFPDLMWSNYVGYYAIRFSAHYDQAVNTSVLRAFLAGLPELQEQWPLRFVSRPGFPGVRITLIKTRDGNFSAGPETWFDEINLLDLHLSKYDGGVYPAQLELATRIARFLGWELLEEENDDGEEDVIIWQPDKQT